MDVLPRPGDRVFRITRTTEPPGLRLEGELDATCHSALSAALSTSLTGSEEVRLDLAALDFIDLGAIRLLTGFAGSGGPGSRLVLDNIPPDIEGLFETVGWERLPGLVQGRKGN